MAFIPRFSKFIFKIMKKLSFLLSALISFGGSAFAQPYVTETTGTGITEALTTLNGAGTIDVFVLNPTDISTIENIRAVKKQ